MNAFVDYLDQFNVLSPSHAKIYDEYTSESDSDRLSIQTRIESFLQSVFESTPRSIIMTGNAGDGKTRLCRTIYNLVTGQTLKQWPISGIVEATFKHGTLRIVKDLSELTETIIKEELTKLQSFMENGHEEKIFYLIAANEGKLTKSLSQIEELQPLSEAVQARFLNQEANNEQLHLVNLQDVTSSLYADRIIEAWNWESNWAACDGCAKQMRCVIRLNHSKMSRLSIRERLVEQYRLLDCLGVHVTMREILIHISYTITGGLTCGQVIDADYRTVEDHSRRAYYDNFYGTMIDEQTGLGEMGAIRHFRKLDPGQLSISAIDDFLLNGDLSGETHVEDKHRSLFDEEIDMLFGYYRKQIEAYRTDDPDRDKSSFFGQMPKFRRKYYFESDESDRDLRQKLVPYTYFFRFVGSLTDKRTLENSRKELVQGLNHAFSKKLIDRSDSQLYAVNDNLLIHESYSSGQIKLTVDAARNDIDHLPSKLYMTVDQRTSLEIRLPVFEYLLRPAGGGLFTALRQEVDILLGTFRNELINRSELNEFNLEVLSISPDRGTYSRHEIDI